MIYNRLFGTRPVVVHSPSDNEVFPRVTNFLLNQPPEIGQAENITILTWNNRSQKSFLERSLDRLNVPYKVLGKGIQRWQNKMKMGLTIQALKNIDTEYVIGVDAFDAVFIRSPHVALERFKTQACKILFNASIAKFPTIKHQLDYEERLYKHRSLYCHLNAGAWIGERKVCLDFWTAANEVEEEVASLLQGRDDQELLKDSEQIRVKTVFPRYQSIVEIDYGCSIFQTLNYPGAYPPNCQDQFVKLAQDIKAI